MDTNPDHLDDETLSALLDGDAGEAGIPAHVAACDRCAARQAELAAARTALAGAPVEPLDELARRRLVAGAVRAADEAPGAPSRWGQRHPAVIGSAAAVLLAVLVGVPFVVGDHGGESKQADKALSAQAPYAARQQAAGVFLGDLGDLTDRDRLRVRLTGSAAADTASNRATAGAAGEPGPSPAAAAAPTAAAPPAGATPAGGGLAGSGVASRSAAPGTPSAPLPPQSSAGDQVAARDRADADACVAALLDGTARGGRLTGSGVGTWRGRPAVVAAFELSGGTVAFVTDRSGCTVLARFTL